MCDNETIAMFGILLIGAIAACIVPFYYCNRSSQQHDKYESIEGESPLVHIKISQPHHDHPSSETVFDTSNNRRTSIESNECTEMKQVAREEGPVSLEEARIVPVGIPCTRRRVSRWICSPALRDQLENFKNSSSELCGSTKVVQAQIEVHPTNSVKSDSAKSLPYNNGNFLRGSRNSSNWNVERTRKPPSAVARRWKNLKKTLICSRGEQSTSYRDIEIDDGQRLGIPFQAANQHSPLEYPAILQKKRVVDVSTSTRISANISDAKTENDEMVMKSCDSENNVEPSPRRSRKDHKPIAGPNTEALPEISLIKRQSVNGQSICDIRISGLSQAQLLDLFQSIEGSESIVTTKEASIISIKFHRRRNSDDASRTRDTSFHELSLRKLYRSLAEILEDLSISKLFRSNVDSEKSDHAAPSIQVTDHSKTLNNSKNETSYLGFPNVTRNSLPTETMFSRSRTLPRRFGNNHVSRFFDGRRI